MGWFTNLVLWSGIGFYYWEIVTFLSLVMFAGILWKWLSSPVNSVHTVNYKENKKELSLGIPKIRKVLRLVYISIFMLMCIIMFFAAFIKMY